MTDYDVHTMVEMINKNCFDEYNSIISMYIFPMLSGEKLEKDMKLK